MTEQQLIQIVAKHEERLAAHGGRIEKTENLTEQIHKLASGVENLTCEVKKQNERMEKNLESQDGRISELEKKGSKKLESIVATVVTVAVTAVMMYFLGNSGLTGLTGLTGVGGLEGAVL